MERRRVFMATGGAFASAVAECSQRSTVRGRVDGSDENLVLYDRATGSYWSQLLARALCGPVAGVALELVPTTFITWGTWLDANPETDVLLPPPASTTA